MVQVQSSWFPLVDRNPQTFVPNIYEAKEEDFVRAFHRLHHTAERPELRSRWGCFPPWASDPRRAREAPQREASRPALSAGRSAGPSWPAPAARARA